MKTGRTTKRLESLLDESLEKTPKKHGDFLKHGTSNKVSTLIMRKMEFTSSWS
jgi:hypothetical protein